MMVQVGMLVKSGGRERTWWNEGGGADRTKDVFSVVLLLCFYKNVGSTVPASMLLTHRSRCLPVVRSVLLSLFPYLTNTVQTVATKET